MTDYLIKEDVFMALTGDITDCTIEEFIARLRDKLSKLPFVTKEKTGHWIKVTNGRGGHECDLCHEYAPSYRSGDEYLTKYCPNCGAKMVEPQESEKI